MGRSNRRGSKNPQRKERYEEQQNKNNGGVSNMRGKPRHLSQPTESRPIEIKKVPRFTSIDGATENQKKVIRAIHTNDIIFIEGPAGTGKTTLAIGVSVERLAKGLTQRIILCRPALEANGERIGFEPGTGTDKLGPYTTPFFQALNKFVDGETLTTWQKEGKISIVPFSYMRGQNLDGDIILDEGQNCKFEQLYLFLTRMCKDSKVMITYDLLQSDLPYYEDITVGEVCRELSKEDGIVHCQLDDTDNQRHPQVRKIIKAFGRLRERRKNDSKRL
jgi:phosphate starvation-inducible PhoH-like protein